MAQAVILKGMVAHIAIVGAGIGGLALAHALNRSGFRVSLLEQADTLSEIGAGLSLWENGLQALEAIALRSQVEIVGHPWSEYEIHRLGKPKVLRNNQILSRDGKTSPLMIKRGSLFGVLLNNVPTSVEIFTAFKVTEISGHKITAEDGRSLSADIIIGADGAHSQVRKQLSQETPRFCKQVCFRGMNPNVGDLSFKNAEDYSQQRHRFGYFRLPKDEAYWFDIVDSETPYAPFEKYRNEIENLSPLISGIVKGTPKETILCHPIEEMPPVTTGHDYIALIGDAAHPMQPSLGQGACLALEDAIVLAKCLEKYANDAPKALQTYVSKRRKRWVLYYKMCRQLGTGALDKGVRGRKMAIARMVHTPQWALSLFGSRIFEFRQNV